ncbi:transmembrane protein 107-like isoform X2 [Asterias rubens]|nr:transmembrane protein 107-like isoform X2 [Asterias rubens]
MYGVTHLIPARFLCLIAHLVVAVTILWARDANVKASLPLVYTQEDYYNIDTGLIVGLILTLVFLALELVGFVSGVTMFVNLESLFSIVAHASACIALSYFLFEEWPINMFWPVFAFCSALPAVVDTVLMIKKVFLTKSS